MLTAHAAPNPQNPQNNEPAGKTMTENPKHARTQKSEKVAKPKKTGKKDKERSVRSREKKNRDTPDKPAAAAGKDGKPSEQGSEADARGSEGSDDSTSEASEDIIVYETPENQSYERKVVIGLLSRVGFREQFWRNKIQSYFVILSFLLTIDNITYFFLFARLFGLFWMVPYAICMLVVGFPLAYLEMAFGQYTSTGIYLVFDRMTPAFVGVGVSALIFNFFLSCVDHMLFADMTSVGFQAMFILSNEMPWSNCLGSHNKRGACHTWSRDCTNLPKDVHVSDIPPAHLIHGGGKEFHLIMQGDTCIRPQSRSVFNGINDRGGQSKLMTASFITYVNAEILDFVHYEQLRYPSHLYLLCSAISLLLCIYIITRHRRVTVLVLTITLLMAFCVISFLFHGVLLLFVPKYPYAHPVLMPWKEGVNSFAPWFAALCLTFRSLKLGQGAWTFFGSQNGFHNNLIFDCLVITLVVTFVTYFYSLFHIVAIGSYTQEISVLDKDIAAELGGHEDMIIYHNPITLAVRLLSSTIIFEGYDTVVVLFYSSLVAMMCLANKIVRLEIIISAFTETMTAFADPNARFTLVIIVCCFNALLQLGLSFQNGYIFVAKFNFVVFPIVGAAIVLFELFVVGIFYGFRMFFSNTSLMVYGVAKSESKKMKLLFNSIAMADWTVLLPICCVYMIVCTIYFDDLLKMHELDFYTWLWICVFLAPIPALMVFSIYSQYSIGNNIYPLFKRNPDLWGPRTRANRVEAERAERMIRQWW